ncbi:DUF2237 family protein [Parvibium lacunae]|uniref:DUF2237 domain-containing protein n=1 Tax=Parvibium lacunae TaxID=1888893 RepID=A0A368L1W6_9BURK|nr:DUF2237 domain-containing protein [Parvibium lacunae]RCS57112.1 DUF2237 domain-containing protein [Parvibium lacunae]
MAATETAKNVLGGPLKLCGLTPRTGYLRDGCCQAVAGDSGSHTVCAIVTAAFLAYSMLRGNDLSTPRPAYDFPGLKPGDRWCLCARRWLEAYEGGCAPRVVLEATHLAALDTIPLALLIAHADHVADDPAGYLPEDQSNQD